MAVFSLNTAELDLDEWFSEIDHAWPFSFELSGDLWEAYTDQLENFSRKELIHGVVNPLEEASLSSLNQLNDEQFDEFVKSSLDYFNYLSNQGIKYVVVKACFNDQKTQIHHDVQARIVRFFNAILEQENKLTYYFPVSINALENSPEICDDINYLYKLISSPRIKFRLTIPFPYDLSQFPSLNRLFAFEIKQLRLLLPLGFNSKLLFEMIRQLKALNYSGKMIFSADEPKLSNIEYLIEEVESLYKK
ncbi:hypothetical protein PQO01_15960 [Lentisphaera marina]|uniref:hypothetical protein n=1 Tax=Lentisphaera marina TaxID=1111041 RepID=UPI0023664441|nr:hypothetical protein [Lentisphaera marina]MDD7986446.1 hypothetical protein [Lentisphaera marina]